MNIALFNKKYWLRRFGEQREVKGYLTANSKDYVISINVHPVGTTTLQALPEGERSFKRLEGHGNVELVEANRENNVKGDLLFYHGSWYECTSSQLWNHTLLAHYNYQFVQVPNDGSRRNDLKAPFTTEPFDIEVSLPE